MHDQDPYAPIPYDPAWEALGQEPVPGIKVFGPVTREDRTPHDGEQGVEKAMWKLLFRERCRKRGHAFLWRSPMYHTGRCVELRLRYTDDEDGARVGALLQETFRELGFMVRATGRRPVDREVYRQAECVAWFAPGILRRGFQEPADLDDAADILSRLRPGLERRIWPPMSYMAIPNLLSHADGLLGWLAAYEGPKLDRAAALHAELAALRRDFRREA